MMLLSQAFIYLLHERDSGQIISAESEHDRDRISIILIQILTKVLQTQEEEGSWADGSCEITAYAILALTNLWLAPWYSSLRSQIETSIRKGQGFLTQHIDLWEAPSYVWIEKITYSSPVLSKAYCIAAVHFASNLHLRSLKWSEKLQELLGDPIGKVERTSTFLSGLPLFEQEPHWRLTASVMEGYLHLPRMLCANTTIFPRAVKANHRYLEYIPLTWTASNALRKLPLASTVIWDMILTSLLIFQVDEYMESTVAAQPEKTLTHLKHVIDDICKRDHAWEDTHNLSKEYSADEDHCRNGIERPRLEISPNNLLKSDSLTHLLLDIE